MFCQPARASPVHPGLPVLPNTSTSREISWVNIQTVFFFFWLCWRWTSGRHADPWGILWILNVLQVQKWPNKNKTFRGTQFKFSCCRNGPDAWKLQLPNSSGDGGVCCWWCFHTFDSIEITKQKKGNKNNKLYWDQEGENEKYTLHKILSLLYCIIYIVMYNITHKHVFSQVNLIFYVVCRLWSRVICISKVCFTVEESEQLCRQKYKNDMRCMRPFNHNTQSVSEGNKDTSDWLR